MFGLTLFFLAMLAFNAKVRPAPLVVDIKGIERVFVNLILNGAHAMTVLHLANQAEATLLLRPSHGFVKWLQPTLYIIAHAFFLAFWV